MTCNRYSGSRNWIAPFLLAATSSFIITSCRLKTVEVIGIERDASDGCAPTERVFQFEVEDGDIPTDVPPEWCTIIEGSTHIICFLHAQNGHSRHGVELPRILPHTDVSGNHPDLECWSAERTEWDAAWDGSDESYHPIWSNDWSG